MSDYKQLARKMSENEFKEFVEPFLPVKISGSKAKVPFWKIYNYIAKVLRTGMQWSELQDFIDKDAMGNREIHYTSVFKRFQLWAAHGVFEKSHSAIIVAANNAGKLDLSTLNGDGTNSIAKKGANVEAIQVTNIKQALKE
jgi:hypothetical protein